MKMMVTLSLTLTSNLLLSKINGKLLKKLLNSIHIRDQSMSMGKGGLLKRLQDYQRTAQHATPIQIQ